MADQTFVLAVEYFMRSIIQDMISLKDLLNFCHQIGCKHACNQCVTLNIHIKLLFCPYFPGIFWAAGARGTHNRALQPDIHLWPDTVLSPQPRHPSPPSPQHHCPGGPELPQTLQPTGSGHRSLAIPGVHLPSEFPGSEPPLALHHQH